MIKLLIREWGKEEDYQIFRALVTLGTHHTNDLIIMDQRLPKRVGEFTVKGENQLYFNSFHSNGYLLNGEIKTESIELNINDTLTFFETVITFLACSKTNPYIQSFEESQNKIEKFKLENPDLKNIVEHFEKVSQDV